MSVGEREPRKGTRPLGQGQEGAFEPLPRTGGLHGTRAELPLDHPDRHGGGSLGAGEVVAEAVGRLSAIVRVIDEGAESAGAAAAALNARGDRIDRVQAKTRAGGAGILAGFGLMWSPPEASVPSRPAAWPFPSRRGIWDFITTLTQRERSVRTLTAQKGALQSELDRVRRQADEQAGQLRMRVDVAHASLRNAVETRAENAAGRLLGRLIALRNERSDTETPRVASDFL